MCYCVNSWCMMFSSGEKFTREKLMRQAPLQIQLQWHLPAPRVCLISPQQPFQSGDSSLLSSSSEQGFLIAILNLLSFFFFFFPFMSSYLNICAGLIKKDVGTTANCISPLTLSPPLHNLYIKVVETFFFQLPPPLFALSGYRITFYTTFYHLFPGNLLTWIWCLIYSPFIWKLRMRKQCGEEKRSWG